MKKYLFSYNDENHYTNFWFDKEYIGSTEDIMDLLTTMYSYGLDDDSYNPYEIATVECNIDVDLNEKDFNILHNFLCFQKTINERIWKCLIKEDYVNAVCIIKEITLQNKRKFLEKLLDK